MSNAGFIENRTDAAESRRSIESEDRDLSVEINFPGALLLRCDDRSGQ
jgi:hypothetical protein